jgi:murein DD-endopeptidase MepM/ murein hydrolase activator NlpD
MTRMPTLGPPRRRSGPGRLLLALALLAAASFVSWRVKVGRRKPSPPAAAALPPPAPAPVEAAAAAPPPSADDPLRAAGLRRASLAVEGPLERALDAQVGTTVGPPLTQVVARALAWWIAMPADLRRGDALTALFEERPGEEPLLRALRFQSHKTGRTHRVYRFQATGDRYARLYDADGRDLELRLDDAPLDDYEQVTSLLRDGRGHKGVDFRAPVGTPVKAPFDAVVARENWNVGRNGGSLELRASGGRSALFLHLSQIEPGLRVGDRVARGQPVAKSGNTGHSFAPHLHYQLMEGARVLDPFAAQKTTRRALPPSEIAGFEAEVRRLDALMEPAAAGTRQPLSR